MARRAISRQYALVLAKYVTRFHDVPPSILSEAGATELMMQALRRNQGISLSSFLQAGPEISPPSRVNPISAH
jgi:hypothetical protein